MEKQKMFNLEYYLGNKHIETLMYNKSKALCIYKMNTLATSSHKVGKFKIVPN